MRDNITINWMTYTVISTQVERKETLRQKDLFLNQANEINRNASAQAELTRSRAKAEAQKLVEQARTDGLHDLINGLGIAGDPERSSFYYLRELRKKNNLNVAVGYQNLYARAP